MRCDKCEGRSGIYRPRCSGDGGKLSPRTACRLRQRQKSGWEPESTEGLLSDLFARWGGEVDNAVFFGYSNKAHDGYLGNAVIGSGATSEREPIRPTLRTIIQAIRIWNYASQSFMRTDLQFCGLIMGDHSKAGINCMFNTASVVGVGVNFHGCGYPRTFIPSFSTGSPPKAASPTCR